MRKIFPGFVFVLVLSMIVYLFHSLLPEKIRSFLGLVSMGLLVGIICNNFLHLPLISREKIGISFCQNQLLKFAIVLLGFGLSIETVLENGGAVFGIILLNILIVFVIVFLFVSTKLLPLKLASLIGIGSAICGNTAISALSPAIDANQDELSFAITVNTLIGTIAVFIYPILINFLGLDAESSGRWLGLVINDTSQVIAAANQVSSEVSDIATSIKLTRNALLAPVLAVIIAIFAQFEQQQNNSYKFKFNFPMFIIFFVIASILNSLGLVLFLEDITSLSLSYYLKKSVVILMLIALTAVGLLTSLKNIRKLGFYPILTGILCSGAISLVSYCFL
jgi:uncharacterized integral membrane protein (TIGR00698 family)